MLFEANDYRHYLKSILLERIAANPSYSLRSMARALEISPAMLSGIISGKKNLSREKSYQVSRKLQLTSEMANYFELLVEFERVTDNDLKSEILAKLQSINKNRSPQNLTLDIFKSISEWYHIPIIELCGIEHLSVTPKLVCEKLGVSLAQATSALDRLTRLELTVANDDGTYKKSIEENYLFQTEIPDNALNNYHQTMIEKGKEAVVEQKISERFIGSETFSFSEENLKEASIIMEECFSKMKALATKKRNKKTKDIYHMGMQFFRLTNNKQQKGKL